MFTKDTAKVIAAEPLRHLSLATDTPTVYSFFERATSTWQYIAVDPATSEGVIIDSVLDYEPTSGVITTSTADSLLAFIERSGVNICRILETHAHADHLTASQYLKKKLGGQIPVGIGEHIKKVQTTFAPIYGIHPAALENTFDALYKDNEEFKLGNLLCRVIHLPGHTPDHVGYVIGTVVFTGDSIFFPDVGSARADFPGGDAKDLFSSMQRLLSLPEDYQLYVGHDYPANRDIQCVSTVGDQKKHNKHAKAGTTEAEFIKFRQGKDATLGTPRLQHPALQVNIRAGKLPAADEEGRVFFKIPLQSAVSL